MKFRDVKLAWKLPLAIAVPAVVLVSLSSALQLKQAASAIEEDHRFAYESFIHEKRDIVEEWLQDSRKSVGALAESFGVRAAVAEFTDGWSALGGSAEKTLRAQYITGNPHGADARSALVASSQPSEWTEAHQRHHVGLRSYIEAQHFYDMFLFDTAGSLIYSVRKEDDFARDFKAGKYADSGLGEVYRTALNMPAGEFAMTDISTYAPSAAPALFMAAPVFDGASKLGVVAIQVPMDEIEHLVAESELLGETGEVYLVDNFGRALTASRHDGGHDALETLPELEQIQLALSGSEAHFEHTTGLNGHDVVAETADVTIPNGEHWGMVLEIDRAEAMQFINKSIFVGIIELVITGVLLCLLVWSVLRGVIKRIEHLAGEMEEVGAQNYDQVIAGQDRGDEVGFISKTLAKLQVRLKEGAEAQAREQEVQQTNQRVVDELSAELISLAQGDFRAHLKDDFPQEHQVLSTSLNQAVDGLSALVYSVRDTAESINHGAQEIAGSADELAHRTEAQAATLEQTAQALTEVTDGVQSSVKTVENVETTVRHARGRAEESGEVVTEAIAAMTAIEKSSNQIKQTVSVIDDIAFQTNLLALNAGVEAARAGEAGQGFAVVASEVRSLARRSAESAMEIKSLIESSGQQVERGVAMVGRTGDALTSIVGQVQEISDLVAEISKSSREQSVALTEINTGMTQLDQVTQGNAAMVEENNAASHMLRSDADKLIEHVRQFKINEVKPHAPQVGVQEISEDAEEEESVEVAYVPEIKQVANEQWADF
ncbi:methyl-accepting chemotaxis protein [Shimia sp. R11_0]|uniref:methyl-accepting chemotaxis protein n=1 Tax=Shimia sp. R11_0 TaxID=2821096 RepID=UPI001ADBBF14|nr:methyl-accepting chemotaxis protein [Shimia sp. R11_0]MBO9476817.1 methyl-accepting chemotaxis protein [Shimia sp. R11_0]